MLTRRAAVLGLTTAVGLGRASLALAAAPTQRRLVVVILRGALDGLATVAPYGDPALAGLAGPLAAPPPGQPEGLRDLGGYFGLHPALAGLHAMYQANELLIVHAVAGPYRVRSHFAAQDCLESGAEHRLTSGWLNRAVAALPPAPVKAEGEAMAFGVALPLLLRGPARASSWAPTQLGRASPEFYAEIIALAGADPVIGPALRQGLRERGFTDAVLGGASAPAGASGDFGALAAMAGEMLARPDGPRIAALELEGWDTHVAQPVRLSVALSRLNSGLVALRQALGPAWQQTAILCMTEFGRTVRVNGTRGTDHGTGTVALLLGGAVAGGRVRTDWPGLAPGRLFEDRDLQPTADLRALAKGVLVAHLGLDPTVLSGVFPDSDRRTPDGRADPGVIGAARGRSGACVDKTSRSRR